VRCDRCGILRDSPREDPGVPSGTRPEGTQAPPAHAFVASDELYRRTFRDVQDVVAAISKIIAAGDYDGWLSYLTSDFVASRSSAEFLTDASNAAVLKKTGSS